MKYLVKLQTNYVDENENLLTWFYADVQNKNTPVMMRARPASLPAGVEVDDDVPRCAVLVNIQQEADIQLNKNRHTISVFAELFRRDSTILAVTFLWLKLPKDALFRFWRTEFVQTFLGFGEKIKNAVLSFWKGTWWFPKLLSQHLLDLIH